MTAPAPDGDAAPQRLLPHFDPESISNLLEHVDGLVKLVLVVFSRIGTSLPLDLPLRPAEIGWLAVIPTGGAFLMLTGVLALAARSHAGTKD